MNSIRCDGGRWDWLEGGEQGDEEEEFIKNLFFILHKTPGTSPFLLPFPTSPHHTLHPVLKRR